MFNRRFPVAFGMIYGIVLVGLLITDHIAAFVVVAVIGGPTLSVLYWLSRRPRTAVGTVPPVEPLDQVPVD